MRFENATEEPTAIHWHGIRLRNAMDGVPGMTQPLVQPGAHFDYAFKARDAGTYWYHAHHRSWEQVAKGLYGPLIIEEATPPNVDADITVTMDDWRLDEDGALMGGFGNRHDFAHGGRLGNQAMIIPSRPDARRGDRVRLRLVNTATARIFPLRLEGLDAVVVALDGMPLPTPRPLTDIRLAPAQRIDLIGDVTGPVNFLFIARDALYPMGTIDVVGENPNPLTTDIAPLPPADVQVPSNAPEHRLSLRMEGGAMGGAHAGDDIWAFNGKSGLPDTPFATFRQGETAVTALLEFPSYVKGKAAAGEPVLRLVSAEIVLAGCVLASRG